MEFIQIETELKGEREIFTAYQMTFSRRELKEDLFMVNKMMREKKGENIFCPTKPNYYPFGI
jgi:hypothetical protein